MRRFFPFLLVCLTLIPLNFTLGYLGGKPIDIVPSDLLILLSPLMVLYLGRFRHAGLGKRFTLALVVYLTFCVVDLLLAQLDNRGGLVSIASFVRAVRPFFIFYAGYMIHFWSRGRAERWACMAAAMLPAVLLLSDVVFNSRFPNPRWGGFVFSQGVYGFPNSPGFFYVVVFTLLLYAAIHSGLSRVLYFGAAALMGLIVVFVASRNAFLALGLVLAALFYFRHMDRRLILLFVPIMVAGIYAIWSSDVNMALLSSKAERSMNEGILYGRLDVWEDVLQVVSGKVILGYGFEPLTENYTYHGTAHNQYIEYLYKTGFVGLTLVGFIWYYIGRIYLMTGKLESAGPERKFYSFLLVAFLVCMVSNFAQPNLTYSITQSFFVFFGGVGAARLGASRKQAKLELK